MQSQEGGWLQVAKSHTQRRPLLLFITFVSAVAEIHVDNFKTLLQCQVYICPHVLLLIDFFLFCYKLHVANFFNQNASNDGGG